MKVEQLAEAIKQSLILAHGSDIIQLIDEKPYRFSVNFFIRDGEINLASPCLFWDLKPQEGE